MGSYRVVSLSVLETTAVALTGPFLLACTIKAEQPIVAVKAFLQTTILYILLFSQQVHLKLVNCAQCVRYKALYTGDHRPIKPVTHAYDLQKGV